MFDPIKASVKIKNEFVDYLSTDFRFRDQRLQNEFITQLNKTISKGPYLEINDVFKTSKSISDLVDEGVLSPLFFDVEKDKEDSKRTLPLYRKLYVHQEEAIKQIVNGNNVVISTGTGSGKTNCFLIPVINDLLREIEEKGELTPGVRAIFIFPMNALANDQIKNIRKLLMNYPQISFGVYNGETESTDEAAESLYMNMFMDDDIPELRKPLENERISRKEMNNRPPNILFTNYAMLEHLLFRPYDDVLFSNSDYRFIVLDEAHVYTGATGIETSMLLRRLKTRISKQKEPQFILTSATLGGTNEEIVKFAKNISGEEFNDSNIIRGSREEQSFVESSLKDYPNELFVDLANEQNEIKQILTNYSINFDSSRDDDELLYDLLIQSRLYYKLRSIGSENADASSKNSAFTLDDIKTQLDLDDDTLFSFVTLCTRAKKGRRALVDARYHFFIRTLEGCYLTLPIDSNSKFTLTTSEYVEGTDRRMFEVAICDDCGSIAVVGKTKDGYLRNTRKQGDGAEHYFLADQINNEIEDDEDSDSEKVEQKEKPLEDYYLCPNCGAISKGKDKIECDCHTEHLHLYKAHVTEGGDVKCCNCHNGVHRRVFIGNEGATSTLATSLFEALPKTKLTITKDDSNNDNPFLAGFSESNKAVLRETKGQFLSFSDNRQDAAKFAWYLSQSYKEFLRRRGICHLVEEKRNENDYKPMSLSMYAGKLRKLFDTTGCFDDNSFEAPTNDNNTNAWVAVLNELARSGKSNSLTSLGFLQFKYMGNEYLSDSVISGFANTYKVSKQTIKDLLDLLFLEIVKSGAIVTDKDNDIGDDEREYIFYSKKQKYISKERIANAKNTSHWLPRQKGDDRYYITNKMYYVKKALNLSDSIEDERKAYSFLSNYWDYLVSNSNLYRLIQDNKTGGYYMPAKNIDVRVEGDPSLKWYYCPKCGKVQTFLANGKCSVPKCEHDVTEIKPEELRKDNHFARLYQVEDMSPLIAKEHTAQLNKKESLRYQEDFIKKEINVLSCSTTFEMGVDIGDLESVFLRDMPPSPSNYNQRAGRAGRSLDSAAYVLTYAKLSSHDMYFYDDPKEMICGQIMPPSFKLENEKIAKRHIYATTLSRFLRQFPRIFNHNKADKFLNEIDEKLGKKGYEIFYDWLNEKRESNDSELKEELKSSIPGDNDFHKVLGLDNYGWVDDFIGDDGILSNLIKTYNENIIEFNKIIDVIQKDEKLSNLEKANRVKSYTYSLEDYKKNEFIDFLARGNILPRYGFPVDTVELEQNESTTRGSKLNLSRDLQIAIADYAPSSEVVANGLMYTSRYIKRSVVNREYGWKISHIAVCPNTQCHAINYSVTPVIKSVNCISCGKPILPMYFEDSIEPVAGFVTEKDPKPIPMTSQEKFYTAPIYYIGDADAKKISGIDIDFNGKTVSIESTTNDSLLVLSRNSFAVCQTCGYSVANEERYYGIKKKDKGDKLLNTPHLTSRGVPCPNPKFKNYTLNHTFKTDVAKISFKGVETTDYETMLSAMYAIYNSVLNTLHIDRKDLYACLSLKYNPLSKVFEYSIIIYDKIAGGSGYSRKLSEDNGETFRLVMKNAYAAMKNCDCDPSCYKCLRSYENRMYHDDLNRFKASNFLSEFTKLED